VVDAMRDRLSDGHVGPRQCRESPAQRRQQLLARAIGLAQADIDFGRLDALYVLVELGPSGSAGSGDHFGFGQQDLFDAAPDFVRLRERCPGQRVRLDRQTAFVELGKECRSHPRDRKPGRDEEQDREGDDDARVIDDVRKVAREPRFQRSGQPAVVSALDRSCARQKRIRQRRRDDDGHSQRGQQRHDVRERERRQQPAFDAGQTEDRQEDQHDDDRREDDRSADLERRFADDLGSGQLLAGRLALVLAQTPHHVLDVDDRVIDERADRDRHAAERHGVDAGAERAQRQHGRGQRERHRGQRDRGGAQIGEEQQHHDDHQNAAVAQRRDDVVDGDFDEIGLPEDLAIDGHALRQFVLEHVELSIQSAGQLDRVGTRLLLNADDHRRFAAARPFATLQGRTFPDIGKVLDQHRPGTTNHDDAVGDLLG
jgi:hypothetical protein